MGDEDLCGACDPEGCVEEASFCLDCDNATEPGSRFCRDCNERRAEDYEYAAAEDRAERMGE